MSKSRKGLLIFVLILVVAFYAGATMMQAAFGGLLTLVGFIFMVESIGWLKWLVKKSTRAIDIIIFVASIMATAQLGVTIAMCLTIAGLGFTLFYAPMLRESK